MSSTSSRTGKKVGSYVICEQIGGGAMGRVWRGLDEALGRPVAIKMLRADLAHRAGLIERFRVEAQVLARLAHPNIAMVYALVEEAGDLYLVMEYVKGETLQCQLQRSGPLDLADCFPIFHPAIDGIQHAHEAGVVHRDIKPSNLMLGPNGQVKWIDFGIAHMRGRERMTRAGGLVGTPEYMAPEQVRGEPGTIRSDVYALGVVLYKMLCGKPPFTGRGEFEVMRAQVECEPPSLRDQGAPLPAALEEAVLRALAKDPAARYPSAAAFRDALVEAGAPFDPAGAATLLQAGTAASGNAGNEITLFDTGMRPPEPTLLRRDSPVVAPTRADLERELSSTHSLPVFEDDAIATLEIAPGEVAETLALPADVEVEDWVASADAPPLPARREPARPALGWLRLTLLVMGLAAVAANWITPEGGPTASSEVEASVPASIEDIEPPVSVARRAGPEPDPNAGSDPAARPAARPEPPAPREVAAPNPNRTGKRAGKRASPPPRPSDRGWEIRR
ncbi:MAG: protein kinase [Myxococcota bacterium]|nr:protein kinase [Myxococcota bacterium]